MHFKQHKPLNHHHEDFHIVSYILLVKYRGLLFQVSIYAPYKLLFVSHSTGFVRLCSPYSNLANFVISSIHLSNGNTEDSSDNCIQQPFNVHSPNAKHKLAAIHLEHVPENISWVLIMLEKKLGESQRGHFLIHPRIINKSLNISIIH